MDETRIAGLLRGRVLALTGAGVSVASGLPTFRGQGGLYEGLNPYDLATPEAFASKPTTVWDWYLMRIRQGIAAKPNAAHHALKELEQIAEHLTIVSSNVDPLHERAGSKVYRLHGDILETRCCSCEAIAPLELESMPERCTEQSLPICRCGGRLRPNVVWFGEYPRPDAIEAVQRELPRASILLEIGASGSVSYGIAESAANGGIPVVRINPDPPRFPGIHCIDEPAEVALPRLVLLAKGE